MSDPGGWMTTAERAAEIRLSPKTVRNRAALLKLERKIVHVGRRRRPVMLLPPASVEVLRGFFLGDPVKPVKKKVKQPS